MRVAAARADYVAERGPFRNSVAAGCGLHRCVPNNQLPEGLLIRVTSYGRFRLCRLHRIHAWQQLAHLREVAGDAVLLPGEVVDLAVGSSAAASGIGVDLGEQLLGLGLGLAGDLVGILFCVADQLPGVLVGVPCEPDRPGRWPSLPAAPRLRRAARL